MKNKKIWLIVLLMSFSTFTFAQRFAYVDSESILQRIPEYTAALKQLDDLSSKWQKEVDAQYEEIEEMYQAYQEDQANMNEQMRRRREDMIVNKEREAKELQRTRFGFEGDLFKERERLLKPIETRVEKAVQAIAEKEGLDIILDKGTETFLYSNPKLDRSEAVIKELGY
ncbi:OmpH family outer membrane protein [Albibacterium indicum]|uniref:OmpH family outer membrane protein n=1 Tax=Albibacterium indicum TaxID=2292082 RepID=UPI00197F4118|nr:OmpH family outer membrane protein [Pedobacter indicus]